MLITDRTDLVQVNRALPARKRVVDTSLSELERVLERPLDTSLVTINRAQEEQSATSQ